MFYFTEIVSIRIRKLYLQLKIFSFKLFYGCNQNVSKQMKYIFLVFNIFFCFIIVFIVFIFIFYTKWLAGKLLSVCLKKKEFYINTLHIKTVLSLKCKLYFS